MSCFDVCHTTSHASVTPGDTFVRGWAFNDANGEPVSLDGVAAVAYMHDDGGDLVGAWYLGEDTSGGGRDDTIIRDDNRLTLTIDPEDTTSLRDRYAPYLLVLELTWPGARVQTVERVQMRVCEIEGKRPAPPNLPPDPNTPPPPPSPTLSVSTVYKSHTSVVDAGLFSPAESGGALWAAVGYESKVYKTTDGVNFEHFIDLPKQVTHFAVGSGRVVAVNLENKYVTVYDVADGTIDGAVKYLSGVSGTPYILGTWCAGQTFLVVTDTGHAVPGPSKATLGGVVSLRDATGLRGSGSYPVASSAAMTSVGVVVVMFKGESALAVTNDGATWTTLDYPENVEGLTPETTTFSTANGIVWVTDDGGVITLDSNLQWNVRKPLPKGKLGESSNYSATGASWHNGVLAVVGTRDNGGAWLAVCTDGIPNWQVTPLGEIGNNPKYAVMLPRDPITWPTLTSDGVLLVIGPNGTYAVQVEEVHP